MIAIIDYNIGNLGSISNMLKKIGAHSFVTANPKDIAKASKLILPGVGAFDAGMKKLEESGLIPLLNERVLQAGVPTLGICLGMQLMTRRSEEGNLPGLGWIDAEVKRFRLSGHQLKVPHMGWNTVTPLRSSPLVDNLPSESRFYFVHSYFVHCARTEDSLLTTSYGKPFHSAFQWRNVMGVQFHPEKSHKFGMALLRNFSDRAN